MASIVSSAPPADLLGSAITPAPPAGPEPRGRPGSMTRLGSMTPPGPMIRLDSMTTDESRSSCSSNSALGSMARLDSPNSRRVCGRLCSLAACACRSGAPGSGSGPAFVISSSGAPPPRDSQPAMNGRRCMAALSAAGRTEA